MNQSNIAAKISSLERSHTYHLGRLFYHEEMTDYLDDELDVYRTMLKQMDE